MKKHKLLLTILGILTILSLLAACSLQRPQKSPQPDRLRKPPLPSH
jgi:hypothetical protein